jgi:uncharacterized protein YyaL (SSP411 family)
MPTNRLSGEKSPYLLQHAHNPVDWYPWGAEAFEKARREDKPIFLSIGYSTCHWCHVMERESFESAEIAEVLNRDFVPVKVDREERPDVDRIYMMFVQATSGGGGWPMSVFLTPELKPFFGGTYFPPDNRYGRPGFRYILEQLANAWGRDRAKIERSSSEILEQLRQYTEGRSGSDELSGRALDSGYFVFRRIFDTRLGGFGGAPKFPRPSVLNFLLRYHKHANNEEALEMVLLTLREMAKGGMNDQLGGGFHRYSVDANWFVPHFEKMLYDQAQLAISYIEAYQITGDDLYAGVARDIFEYVLRDMTSPDGGFFSAEDADSVIDPANPHEKGEGAFYIWSYQELEESLGRDVEWFSHMFGVERDGNVHSDPHGEFTGKNILYQAHTIEETASRFDMSVEEIAAGLDRARRKLMEIRNRRIRPHLDDKVLTAWNGLMISAFAKGAQALGEKRYYEAARRAADFIIARMRSGGVLLRRHREGEAAIPGFLDDYAFFVQALLDLYETGFDLGDLDLAIELAERQIELFMDSINGGFFSTQAGESDLVLRLKDDYDGAEPSGNSVAALNLLRLAQITGRADFEQAARSTLKAFAGRLAQSPETVPQLLVAHLFAHSTPKQVVVAGDRNSEETKAMLRYAGRRFVLNRVMLLVDSDESRARLGSYVPAIQGMSPVDGKAAVYVCENYMCQLPVTDVEALERLLQ